MAAPGKFENQRKRLSFRTNVFIGKNLNNFDFEQYALWFKVIFLFQWKSYFKKKMCNLVYVNRGCDIMISL